MFERTRKVVSDMLRPKSVSEIVTKDPVSGLLETVIMDGGRKTMPEFGTTALLRSYSTMPWLRAVTNKIGQAVGTTQWKLFVQRDNDGKAMQAGMLRRTRTKKHFDTEFAKQRTIFDLEEIEDHPLLELLHHGNDQLPGQMVFQTTQIHLDLVGEAFWLLERNQLGVPMAIWPLPPNWVMDMPKPDKPFFVIRMHSKQMEIPITEMIRFMDPDPKDPYGRGSGISRSLSDELETDEYAAKHIKSFFYNNARPDIIISADHLSPADTKRLEEKWLDKQQGFWNRFKPFFLSRKVDVQLLSQSFESMQLTELRKQERDTVLQVFGAPPEKFGILSASNRSTIVSADLFWTKDVLLPRVEHIRNTIQDRLVPMFDEKLVLGFVSPSVDDKQLNLQVMSKQPGAFTKNEWRKMAQHEGLGEDGEVFIVQPGTVEVPIGEDIPEAQEPNQEEPEEEQNGRSNAVHVEPGDVDMLDMDRVSRKVMRRLAQTRVQ